MSGKWRAQQCFRYREGKVNVTAADRLSKREDRTQVASGKLLLTEIRNHYRDLSRDSTSNKILLATVSRIE